MSKLYTIVSTDTRKRLVTACGRQNSEVHTSSWDHGVTALISISPMGRTVIHLWTTGGSHDGSIHKHIATVTDGVITYKSASERIIESNTKAMGALE